MVKRFLETPGRIVVSKAGVDVSVATDSQKIFDSDWNWSGVVLECGAVVDPGGASDFVIMFRRNYGYAPCVIARQIGSTAQILPPWDGPDITSPMTQGVYPFIFSDRIVFPRARPGGTMNYGTVEYEAYGVD